MSPGVDVRERALDVWGGRITMRVKTAGQGAPLVYLHAASGLTFDPFLVDLSTRYTIYAPEMPGTSAGDPNAIHQVDNLSDLVLIYEETIAKLELPAAPVVLGPSFGGMLAAELASYFPTLFAKVVLCAPLGLWRPDLPIANWMTTPASELPALLFKDPGCAAAKATFAPPSDPALAVNLISSMVWARGCTGKFVWPIPEKGLRARLHRVTAPALIVWGKDDALIPVGYASEFGDAIRGCRIEILRDCGHIPQAEQLEATLAVVRRFLESG
jgi:pimeloyl-ACP methyl ester carboxylesterase